MHVAVLMPMLHYISAAPTWTCRVARGCACLGKIVRRSTQVQNVGAIATAERLVAELNAVQDQTTPAQLTMR